MPRELETCPKCDGDGTIDCECPDQETSWVDAVGSAMSGGFSDSADPDCPDCKGTGKRECPICDGEGEVLGS